MRKKILTVTDTFGVTSKGLVILQMGGLKTTENLTIGTPIVIVRPDNSEVKTQIDGFENILTVSGNKGLAFLIKDLSKRNVLNGSEVFIETDK